MPLGDQETFWASLAVVNKPILHACACWTSSNLGRETEEIRSRNTSNCAEKQNRLDQIEVKRHLVSITTNVSSSKIG